MSHKAAEEAQAKERDMEFIRLVNASHPAPLSPSVASALRYKEIPYYYQGLLTQVKPKIFPGLAPIDSRRSEAKKDLDGG